MRKIVLTFSFLAAMAISVCFAGASFVYAQSGPPGAGNMQPPAGIFGKVTAISGTTITLNSPRSNITYTVDASGAAVMKNGTTSVLSSIGVGDMVIAQGTVSGDSVTATKIMDGFIPGMGGPGGMMHGGTGGKLGSSTRGYFGGRPSGTSPFASGTFLGGYHHFSSSTPSSTASSGASAHPGFFASIGNFFGGMFSHFKF